MKQPFNYEQPKIIKRYIPTSETTRPRTVRTETRGSVTHHTALIDVPADNFGRALINKGRRDNKVIKTYGREKAYLEKGVFKSSYHMVIDYDGTIYIFIPLHERAYASGGTRYSMIGKEVFNSDPSLYTIDKEVCVSEPDWHINNRQQEVVAEIDADIMLEYDLSIKDLYKHFDIALSKPYCPAYYIRGLNWQRHLSMVKKMYKLKLAGLLPRLDLYEKGEN